ncbi:MAG TPA: phosphotransferase [Streptosporangiaceae bacterium]|nr:phosphotransferase [Streptosporangiaceae bacterium]
MMPAGGRLDTVARLALAEFDAGPVLTAEPLPGSTPAVCKVVTSTGAFVLKPADRIADVELQAEVAARLNAVGVRQARVLRTSSGSLVTTSGHVLLEYLPGSVRTGPTPEQVRATMRHFASYHLALGQVAASLRADDSSLWARVAEPGFLVAALPELLASHGLACAETAAAIDYLDRTRGALDALPRQLVHGDIGPDNVLMSGDEVVSLIDFTPHWASVLFAASSAMYWYHVAGRSDVSIAELKASLSAMADVRPWTDNELALWPAGLVLEALRRLATPLELARVAANQPAPSTAPRLAALRAVVRVLPGLSDSLARRP